MKYNCKSLSWSWHLLHNNLLVSIMTPSSSLDPVWPLSPLAHQPSVLCTITWHRPRAAGDVTARCYEVSKCWYVATLRSRSPSLEIMTSKHWTHHGPLLACPQSSPGQWSTRSETSPRQASSGPQPGHHPGAVRDVYFFHVSDNLSYLLISILTMYFLQENWGQQSECGEVSSKRNVFHRK